MKNKIPGLAGFTLIEIMIVVAIIGLLAAMAIPNLLQSQRIAKTNICITNLRYIEAAKQQWALEQRAQESDTPAAGDLQPYLGPGTGELPSCPADPAKSFITSYAPQNVATKATCLISPATHVLP